MSTISINGKTYTGKNVSIINGEVIIDGVKQNGDKLQGVVRVEITGDPASIDCDAPVTVKGNVKGNVIADGPVTCGNVTGDVTADGPCTCGNVGGDDDGDEFYCWHKIPIGKGPYCTGCGGLIKTNVK
jgi:hypothetical protein